MLYTLSIAGKNAVRLERQDYLLNVMIRIVLEFAGSPRIWSATYSLVGIPRICGTIIAAEISMVHYNGVSVCQGLAEGLHFESDAKAADKRLYFACGMMLAVC